jgi:hypothetical protein
VTCDESNLGLQFRRRHSSCVFSASMVAALFANMRALYVGHSFHQLIIGKIKLTHESRASYEYERSDHQMYD